MELKTGNKVRIVVVGTKDAYYNKDKAHLIGRVFTVVNNNSECKGNGWVSGLQVEGKWTDSIGKETNDAFFYHVRVKKVN